MEAVKEKQMRRCRAMQFARKSQIARLYYFGEACFSLASASFLALCCRIDFCRQQYVEYTVLLIFRLVQHVIKTLACHLCHIGNGLSAVFSGIEFFLGSAERFQGFANVFICMRCSGN
jgi:hypothetical protein